MSLQWYPGHMAKAIREIKESLPKIDLIIEMLDARMPFSSENPILAGLKKGTPRIKVFSKSDLADPELNERWKNYFENEQHIKVLMVSTKHPEKYRQLIPLIKKILAPKLGGAQNATVLICGIPNVGKSTLINTLVDRAVAKTGNEAAITKGQQRIKLDDQLMLLDTPGVLWPKVNNVHSAYRQAITGAIKEAITDNPDIAFYLAEYLLANYPENLQKKYHLETCPEMPLEFFQIIGRQKGALRKGGEVDIDKISTSFLTDFRSGSLGEITLETPEMMQHELIEVEKMLAEKAEKKAAKEAKKKKR